MTGCLDVSRAAGLVMALLAAYLSRGSERNFVGSFGRPSAIPELSGPLSRGALVPPPTASSGETASAAMPAAALCAAAAALALSRRRSLATTMYAEKPPRGAFPQAPQTNINAMRKQRGRPFDWNGRQIGWRKYEKNNTPIPFKVHVQRGDIVQVVYGPDRGLVTQVLRVWPLWNKVLCAGVNLKKKYVRPDRQDQVGMTVNVEYPIHVTNILHYDMQESQPGFLGIRFEQVMAEDGTPIVRKVRYNKTTGNIILPRLSSKWIPLNDRESPTML